ncbi:MAG: ATP-binding protein, partial [Anaerolineae bacterium]|nr:ATP-binding protein [Anaerolineae bacterium]
MSRHPLFSRLRWRIVAAHMLVVIVGVIVVLAMSRILLDYVVPSALAGDFAALASAESEAELAEGTSALLAAFRSAVLASVAVAATGAIVAALITGLVLARQILHPLDQLAGSARRVAAGRYSERVSVPDSEELALVASSFNQMAKALQGVEEQRVTLIGDVAHELRTPLTALAGYLEGLVDGLFEPEEETFDAMHQEVRRLQRLIDDLQALSRVEAGQISLQMESQPLLPLVELAAASLLSQAAGKGVTLSVSRLADSPLVHVDADRVLQILHNLLGNAIRYTPEGGRIDVKVSSRERNAEVTVTDTGIGIPAEALPYIFERFFRVDTSRSRRSGGSGIGLTISRYLAWAMGGELTAASTGAGRGSTFTLLLPLAPPD